MTRRHVTRKFPPPREIRPFVQCFDDAIGPALPGEAAWAAGRFLQHRRLVAVDFDFFVNKADRFATGHYRGT
ncbi:MAG: hypothetical protein QMD04_09680 [Anaerolineales bacterium]|nr:hypothetical protein [Anaerolineales bacterium]